MYPNPANNYVSAGGGRSDSNVVPSNNVITQDMNSIQQRNINYNGIQTQQQASISNNNKNVRKKPYVKITVQPAGKALRFRYECEGRSAGSIPGVNSTSENKTYPTIEIVGYKGRAVVVVSCVTKDQPYRPHPHNLVGKEGCKKGVCTLEINPVTMKAVFSNLGIQCVKKKDIDAALRVREEIRVDPFKTGFSHRLQPSSIDLNSVRLCFQVFMESEQKGRFTRPITPVVSEPIFDKKAMSDLVICRLSSCSSSVLGNKQIFMFCEKVAKEDIAVRFFEENNGQTVWEAYGDFRHSDVHKQTGIAFKTPRYRKIDITEPAKVFLQLKRPSDGVTSEPLPFEFIPLESDPEYFRRKRRKINGDAINLLLQQHKNPYQNDHQDDHQTYPSGWNGFNIPAIKTEPRDVSPQPIGIYGVQPTPSPQPLSPLSAYSHNTPSPYNMSPSFEATPQVNQQTMSPHQQYDPNNLSVRPAVNACCQHTQQQQYNEDNFRASIWETKFDTGAGANNNNLNNSNSATIQNLLTLTNTNQEHGNGTNAMVNNWNLPANNFYPHQHHLQQQQQYQQHATQNDTVTIVDNPPVSVSGASNGSKENNIDTNDSNNNDNNNNEHGLSNLLTFDSEQLVRINSEDQQMLQLDSEDLRISSLSIST